MCLRHLVCMRLRVTTIRRSGGRWEQRPHSLSGRDLPPTTGQPFGPDGVRVRKRQGQ